MSFTPPTTSTITLTSPLTSIRGTDHQIIIHIKTLVGYSSAYNLKVVNLGEYEVDFAFTESGSVTDFKLGVPSFSVTVRKDVNDGTNIDSLVEMFGNLDIEDLIVIESVYGSSSDYFITTPDKIEYDYKARTLTLNGEHPLKFGEVVLSKNWSTALSSISESAFLVGATNVVQVRNFIEEALKQMGDNVNVTIKSDLYEAFNPPSNGDDCICMLNAGGVLDDFNDVVTLVKKHALSECAYVGNVLGEGFYFARGREELADRVTLTGSDFTELSIENKSKSVKDYSLTVNFGSATISESFTFNAAGLNDITVTVGSAGQEWFIYDGTTDNRWEQGTDFIDQYVNGTTGYGTSPARSSSVKSGYKDLFLANSASRYTISGKIKGIDKIKPYNWFTVDTSVDDITNMSFVFSYMKYNLTEDTIEFEAYRVV